jgi:hypothetical protein
VEGAPAWLFKKADLEHLAVDEADGEILSMSLTENSFKDNELEDKISDVSAGASEDLGLLRGEKDQSAACCAHNQKVTPKQQCIVSKLCGQTSSRI